MDEKSLFIEFMGDSPMTRIFDYLLTEQDVDFSISDIARNARVGRTTIYRIWDKVIISNVSIVCQ